MELYPGYRRLALLAYVENLKKKNISYEINKVDNDENVD